jgi:hypothetical protein
MTGVPELAPESVLRIDMFLGGKKFTNKRTGCLELFRSGEEVSYKVL